MKKILKIFVVMTMCIGTATGQKVHVSSETPNPPVATLSLVGDWRVRVTGGEKEAIFKIDPPEVVKVKNEIIANLPVFNPNTAEYARGTGLPGVKAQECSVTGALIPGSLVVRDKAGKTVYTRGKDYEVDEKWGVIGRLNGGAIDAETSVSVNYSYGLMRIDAIGMSSEKAKLTFHKGVPHVGNPDIHGAFVSTSDEVTVAYICVRPGLKKLTNENLWPILEHTYPEPVKPSPTVAERLIPETMTKLKTGGKVRVLAWGDSVTDGSYLPGKEDRWQERFIEWLRQQYPQADIELVTEAWGGRNTDSYRNEPAGSVHNYKEKVLDAKPDLIISEFVNDSGFDEPAVFAKYGRLLGEFREIGAEWIILTPHYVRPDWMGIDGEKDIDDDPRLYVKALRKFAAENNVALADASLRWGRLWRRGIPYLTLMMNNINHPNAFGQGLFVDALKELFPQSESIYKVTFINCEGCIEGDRVFLSSEIPAFGFAGIIMDELLI